MKTIDDLNTLSPDDLTKLEKHKSDNGTYTIPVEWSVYSTVIVEADNLKEALAKVLTQLDDIPLSSNPTYIDGSYSVSVSLAEDAVNAQDYSTDSGIYINPDGTYTRL